MQNHFESLMENDKSALKLSHQYTQHGLSKWKTNPLAAVLFSVGPHMNQTMPVTSIYLIPFFVIEKGSYVFQGLCDCASHPGEILLLWAASTAAAFTELGTAAGSIYFS